MAVAAAAAAAAAPFNKNKHKQSNSQKVFPGFPPFWNPFGGFLNEIFFKKKSLEKIHKTLKTPVFEHIIECNYCRS